MSEEAKKIISKSNITKEQKELLLRELEELYNMAAKSEEAGTSRVDEESGSESSPKEDEEKSQVWSSDESEESEKRHRITRKEMQPEIFNGDINKARQWIADYRYCATVNRWDKKKMAERFPAFLGGSARSWYKVTVMGKPIEKKFSQIEEQFGIVFIPHSSKAAIAKEIDMKRQRTDEAVSNFIVDMRLLCTEYDANMPEEEIVDKIMARVLPSFEPNLTHEDPRTIADLMKSCTLLEEGNKKKNKTAAVSMIQRDRTCYVCKEAGHIARNCTKRNQDKIHYKPRNSNYRSQGYRGARQGRAFNRSSYSNSNNSRSNNYANNNNANNRYNGQNRPQQAPANSNNNGHQTPNEGAKHRGRGGYRGGHQQRDNGPERNSDQYQNSQASQRPQVAHTNYCAYIMPEEPITFPVFVNRSQLRATADSGSAVTLVSEQTAAKLGWPLTQLNDLKLRVADGRDMGLVGQAEVEVTIYVDNRKVEATLDIIVARSLPVEMIFGLDAQRKMGIIINGPARKIQLAEIRHNNTISSGGNCYTTTAETIPPRTTVLINAIFPLAKREDIFVKNAQHANGDASIPNLLVSPKKERAMIMITNNSDRKIELNENAILASWESMDSAKGSSVNLVTQTKEGTNITVGDQLNPIQIADLRKVIEENGDVFSDGSFIGRTNINKHRIVLKDDTPINQPLRRSAYAQRETIEKNVSELLQKKIIQYSSSPYNSPMVLVRKKDGAIRCCIDFRAVNAKTKKWAFPLPRQDDVLEGLAGAKFMTTLDCNQGFYQIELDDESREITAFSTPDDHYEFTVMPFGLFNAAQTFQKTINIALKRVIGVKAYCYMDDIVIFSKTFEQHLLDIQEVINLLRKSNLTIKLSKCSFAYNKIELLGHIVDERGIYPQKSKLQAIENIPEPKSVEDVRRFLGLIGYYRRFIPRFADLAAPLTDLTKKSANFVWNAERQQGFLKLKEALIKSDGVSHYQPGLPLQIRTDASKVGIAGILLQLQRQEWRILACASRRLSETKSNYTITELEALAVIFSLEKFRTYVYGQPVLVIVDHCALCQLAKSKQLNARLTRWALYLQEYNLNIIYKAGRKHRDADCLSRSISLPQSEPIDEERMTLMIIPTDDWSNDYDDEESRQIMKDIKTGQSLFELIGDNLFRDRLLFVPLKRRNTVIDSVHEETGHGGIEQTSQRVAANYYWSTLNTDVERRVRQCIPCQMYKTQRVRELGEMSSIETHAPFQMVASDFYGPLSTTTKGNKHVLLAIDVFSKYVVARPAETTSADVVKKFVIEEVLRFGAPISMLFDNATCFRSKVIKELAMCLGIRLIFSTPHHHEGNGVAERAIETLKTKLSILQSQEEKEEWDSLVPFAVLAMNAVTHKSTRLSPHEVIFGKKLRSPNEPVELQTETEMFHENLQTKLEYIRKEAHMSLLESHASNKTSYDARHTPKKYKVGDIVKIAYPPAAKRGTTKFSPLFKGPFKIIKEMGDNVYRAQLTKGQTKTITHAHVSRIFPFHEVEEEKQPDEANEPREAASPVEWEQEAEPQEQAIGGELIESPSHPATTGKRRKQAITMREVFAVMLAIPMMLILAFLPATETVRPLERSELIIWEVADIPILSGVENNEASLTITSPCTDLFGNSTRNAEKLKARCEGEFHSRISLNVEKFCGPEAKRIKERVATAVTGIYLFNRVLASYGTSDDRAGLKQLQEVADSHANITNQLSAAIQAIRDRVINQEATAFEYRSMFKDRIDELQKELTIDIAAATLMALFLDKVSKIEYELLSSQDDWKIYKRISSNLYSLLGIKNQYTKNIYSLGKAQDCSFDKDSNRLVLTYSTPIIDNTSLVMKSTAFTHLNGSTNNLCVVRYQGPALALHNITANCSRTLEPSEVSAERAVRIHCRTPNVALANDKSPWSVSDCKNMTAGGKPYPAFQVYTIGNYNHIYCYGEEVKTAARGEEHCPAYPFKLHVNEEFESGSYTWKVTNSRVEKATDWGPMIAARLNDNFESHYTPIVVNDTKPEDLLTLVPNATIAKPTKWLDIERKNDSLVIRGVVTPILSIANTSFAQSISKGAEWIGEVADDLTKPFQWMWSVLTWARRNLTGLVIGALVIGILVLISFMMPFINIFLILCRQILAPIKLAISMMYQKKKDTLPTYIRGVKEKTKQKVKKAWRKNRDIKML